MTQAKNSKEKQIRWDLQLENCFQELYNPILAHIVRKTFNL